MERVGRDKEERRRGERKGDGEGGERRRGEEKGREKGRWRGWGEIRRRGEGQRERERGSRHT